MRWKWWPVVKSSCFWYMQYTYGYWKYGAQPDLTLKWRGSSPLCPPPPPPPFLRPCILPGSGQTDRQTDPTTVTLARACAERGLQIYLQYYKYCSTMYTSVGVFVENYLIIRMVMR